MKKKFDFPIESEHARCLFALNSTGIISPLSKSGEIGIVGFDGDEYPFPSLDQIEKLFAQNKELIKTKVPQGFDRLQLTPMAIPMPFLIERMKNAIVDHAAEERIFQTRNSPTDPLIPARINKEKIVWIWETLRLALDTNEIVYFPKEYSLDHRGKSKTEVLNDREICAVPGWSIGIIESAPIMPKQGHGKMMAGRRQLEIGLSPREYLKTMRSEEYHGETGMTLEDFIVKFIIKLEETGEVSNDIRDDNALWCLGQYMKIPYAEVVPAGRWIGELGRARLDMHRTGNKACTKNVGASTIVRLVG